MIHPLFVHLPIGIILLAVCFEWIVHRERNTFLGASLPVIWRIGAVAAIISCASGWWQRSNGLYTGDTIDLHQWAGILTAVMATIAGFLPHRFWWGTLTGLVVIVTGHFGGSLTHGEGFLFPATVVHTETMDTQPNTDLPDTTIAPASAAVIQRLQRAGLTVTPVAQNSPWLSVSFVNQYTPPDSLFDLLRQAAPQITYLNLSGVQLPASAWSVLEQLPCLSKVYLNGSSVKDEDLQHLAGHRYLHYLNLSNTAITGNAGAVLAKFPALQHLFLYRAKVTDWPALLAALPGARIDTGNYKVPTLATDTVMVKEEKKY